MRNKTKDKLLSMVVIIIIIFALIIGTVVVVVYVGPRVMEFFNPVDPPPTANTTTTTTTTTPTGGGTVETLQWSLTTNDRYAGGLADCAVAIYDPVSHTALESGETGSDGVWTSSLYYTSDALYDLKFGNGTFVEHWELGVAVPRYSGTVLTGAKHRSSFTVTDQGTFTLAQSYGTTRTTISDAGSYNCTTLGNSNTFHFSIYNSELDSGFWSSRNPILDMDCNAVLEVWFNGTEYQDVQWDNSYQEDNDGARQRYFIPLADVSITYDKDAQGNTIYGGQFTVSATLDFTDVSGDAVDVNIKLILGTSVTYLDGHSGLPSSSYAYTYSTSIAFSVVH